MSLFMMRRGERHSKETSSQERQEVQTSSSSVGQLQEYHRNIITVAVYGTMICSTDDTPKHTCERHKIYQHVQVPSLHMLYITPIQTLLFFLFFLLFSNQLSFGLLFLLLGFYDISSEELKECEWRDRSGDPKGRKREKKNYKSHRGWVLGSEAFHENGFWSTHGGETEWRGLEGILESCSRL